MSGVIAKTSSDKTTQAFDAANGGSLNAAEIFRHGKVLPRALDSKVTTGILPLDPFGHIDVRAAVARSREPRMAITGVPTVRRDGVTYLAGEVSNFPKLTQGVQSVGDVVELGGAIGESAARFGQATLNSWSKSPHFVNESLLKIGPALDRAVNYYSSTSLDQIAEDARSALGTVAETLAEKLEHPLTIKEQGDQIECASLFFLPGRIGPVSKAEVEVMGLEKMTLEELEAQGIRKIEDHGAKFINKETFGVENFQVFDARTSMKDGVLKFDVDYISQPDELPRPNLFGVFNRIAEIARSEGATEVEVRGVKLNEELFGILRRRYQKQFEYDGLNHIFRFKL
jgi:hypothetical protein